LEAPAEVVYVEVVAEVVEGESKKLNVTQPPALPVFK
jgi:hypothetical protein